MKTPAEIMARALMKEEITMAPIALAGQQIAALDAAGYVIVPREPTEEMITTASQLYGTVRAMLRAVLAAKS
ncbi:MAG: hypothetical protein ACR2OV_00125 [Hyphomicrobiaceae bacterium]